MRIGKKRVVILLIIIFVVLLIFLLRYQIMYPVLHVEYNGKITECRFDVKGYSYFQIDNGFDEFEMHYLDCDLQLGDSMIKKMDDSYIYHYREKKLVGIYSAGLGIRYR